MLTIDAEASKEVIKAAKSIFVRFGSTRLLLEFAFLGFLGYLASRAPELGEQAMWLGFASAVILLFSYTIRAHTESENGAGAAHNSRWAWAIGIAVMAVFLSVLATKLMSAEMYNPDARTTTQEWKAVGQQQDLYIAAKKAAYKNHRDMDYEAALALCLWPIQKAWIQNNRAYHYIQDRYPNAYSSASLTRAESWLLSALENCAEETQRRTGVGGAAALVPLIESNLIYVRTRMAEKE